MSLRVLLGGVFFVGGLLPAQIFSTSAITATPIAVTCTVPGLPPLVDVTPAGTPAGAVWMMPTSIGTNAGATAHVDGYWLATESQAQLSLAENASAWGQGVTTIASHDYLVTLQATVPTPVLLTIQWHMQLDPGQPMPSAQVDVGDDGQFDFFAIASGQTMTVPLTIGSTPLLLRTRTSLAALVGNVQTDLTCIVTPNFGVTASTAGSSTGCANILTVGTTFEHELVLTGITWPAIAGASFMVVGWGLMPVTTPIPLGTCLLGPTPDVVLLTPDGKLRVDLQTVTSPTTFLAQSVGITWSTGLLVASATKVVHVP